MKTVWTLMPFGCLRARALSKVGVDFRVACDIFLTIFSLFSGGAVAFKTDRVHLRHFNTGKYLSMKPAKGDASDKGYVLTLQNDPSDTGNFDNFLGGIESR